MGCPGGGGMSKIRCTRFQSGNLVGNSLVGTCLTLPNLGFLWVFFKYPKISKNGNPLFFPVLVLEIWSITVYFSGKRR